MGEHQIAAPAATRAVFLDRDGVINKAFLRDGISCPPLSVAEFELLPGVVEACTLLKRAGFLLVIVTNQPDVGRGSQTRAEVEAIHTEMCRHLPLDRVEVCFDPGRGEASEYRKPAPGMLLTAARELNIDISRSFMIGDRATDIQAGIAAGCAVTILIAAAAPEKSLPAPDHTVANLLEAAKLIVQRMENQPSGLRQLRIKIFADGADKAGMLALNADPLIQGLTTNPTLMCKAGIRDYEAFARDVLQDIRVKPISFEVLSDDFSEMRRQALKISSWQDNVYVKVPITNSIGESAVPLIQELAREGVKVNITAILTLPQVEAVSTVLQPEVPSVVSVLAGRIADTGCDPVPMMRTCLSMLRALPHAELLWASVREVFNIYQADQSGCHIVTVQHDILAKAVKMSGASLDGLSLDTVKMFKTDAEKAGFTV